MDRRLIRTIGATFADSLRRILGDKLGGAYIYGAAAFHHDLPTDDIDFHVILRDELTAKERAELEDLHETLAREFPPLGGEMDG